MKKQPKKRAKRPEVRRSSPSSPQAVELTAKAPPVPTDAVEEEISPDRPGPPVAGIGASAGGLDAYKKFFSAMPDDSGIAFVLIPHLDPKHESLMVELIGKHTGMPVVEAVDGMAVEANRVYIIPPNKYMTIADGVLRLRGPVERGGPQTSIDLFLRSLGEDRQEKAICIILSGTGAHGTLGLRAVKAAGGLAMVQDPGTADYPAMPQNAVGTDLADYVLPVEQMPRALVEYIQNCHVNGGKDDVLRKEAGDDLNQVLALVRARTNLDFRSYRKKMLARRVERRMSLSHFDQISGYLAFLREHPDELHRLCRDLLISVTSFFRDPEAWQSLAAQVIAPLVRGKDVDAPIRIWCTGCATGEEPYTLGILLLEQLAAAQKNCPVQIFATDVDEDSLETARQAVYPESISADVSPERLARYFTRVSESSFQVSKQLRETVIFARQNLITDPPFSKLDLVVCRNLLIYLEQEVQKKVIALLHFSLNEGGTLFLGNSETIGRNIDLFEPLSSKWRIYRRIGPSRANNVQFPVSQLEPRLAKAAPRSDKQASPRLPELAQDFLLRRFALACVVINRNYEIVHFAGPTEDYLIQPSGPPTHDLLALARPGLESKLRVVVQRAIRESSSQSVKDVMMRHGDVSRRINIEVEPLALSRQTEGLLLIAFQEQPNPVGETLTEGRTRAQTAESDLMRQLEQELETTREDLQSTIEEQESSNEELKASNEEIMSMNEELQSANEELETSKEELQSLNEELSTVNSQLQDKVSELETANTDIANFLNCTDIAAVFLDLKHCVRRFTPAATRLYNLIAGDVGRPIGDITKRFADDDLLKDSEESLRDLAPREAEVRLEDGNWCLRRIVPYRTLDNRIGGVVFTFVDITERKQAADAVVRRLATIVETSADAIFSLNLDGTILTWNAGAERLHGFSRMEAIGQPLELTVPADRIKEWASIVELLHGGEPAERLESERVRKDGQRFPVELTVSPLYDGAGRVSAASVVARDITDRKQGELALRISEERLRAILNAAADSIITIDERGIIQAVNPVTERLFGYTSAELVGQNIKTLMPSPYREGHDGYLERYLRTGRKHIIGVGREAEGRRKDGSVFPVSLAVSEVDHLRLFTGIVRDITRQKQLEREIVEIASLEQRRIGQDLHDTVGQELTGLNLMVDSLRAESTGRVELIDRMSLGLRSCQRELRSVLRGLLPVSIDHEGLMAALADLAERIQADGFVNCEFVCCQPVMVADNLTATHLFLIAKEAVHNALKHARPRNVRITLESAECLSLRVEDDGIGMPAPPTEIQGVGLRIMRNRAAIIGAELTIESVSPSGTAVTCTMTRAGHEQE